jgi:DNA-binding transcriptional LysR family regulator
VSAPAAFGRKHVAPHAPGFLADKPDMQLSFNLTDRVVDLVREGYDLSIRIGGSVDPNFVAVKLASNRRVVCGTPAYFRKHGLGSLDDLLRHNCRVQPAGRPEPRLVFPAPRQDRDDARDRQSRLQRRRAAASLGRGESRARLALDLEIAAQLETGELETVLDEYALPDYDILAVYPQQRYAGARALLHRLPARRLRAPRLLEQPAVSAAARGLRSERRPAPAGRTIQVVENTAESAGKSWVGVACGPYPG